MKSDLPAKGGRYLYCVIKGEAEDLNLSGIDNQVVSTLVYKGLTVVAHRCEPEPYFSKDSEVVTKWLAQQHKIVEEYWLRYNDVMPFTFNTIIKSDAGGAPEDLLFRWLEDNYGYIQNKLSSIEGRKEYGVQVIMDSKKAAEVLVNSDEEVVRLKVDLDRSAAGKAFLIKEKINTRLKVLIAAEADNMLLRRGTKCLPDQHRKNKKTRPP